MTVRLEQPIKERQNYSPLVKPMLMLVTLIILNITIFKIGFTTITSQFDNISKKKEAVETLEAKVNVLSDLGSTVLASNESLLLALPSRNPALVMLGQYDNLSNSSRVSLEDTSIGTQSQIGENISQTTISVTLQSDNLGDLFEFSSKLRDYLPLNNVEDISVKRSENAYKSTIQTAIYWSALPVVIGGTTEPVSQLTSDELLLVNEINSRIKPEIQTLQPQDESTRQDPFN